MEKISNWIRELKVKHVILFTLAISIVNRLLVWGGMAILYVLGITKLATNVVYMIMELLALAIALLLAVLCKQTQVLRCGAKGLFGGLWSGMIFFILAVLGCGFYITNAMEQGEPYKSILEIIAFIVFVFLVGLAEEILYRGVIADSIFEQFGKSTKGVIWSVVLGGCIFGMAHVTNIVSGQSVEATIIQMIAVSLTGMLFTAIYLRHRNVYAVAILHAVLDFLTMFERGFLQNYSIRPVPSEIDFWASLRQSLISQSVFLIVAVFVLRPKIMKTVVERRKGDCPD